jgi:hypothetical protein
MHAVVHSDGGAVEDHGRRASRIAVRCKVRPGGQPQGYLQYAVTLPDRRERKRHMNHKRASVRTYVKRMKPEIKRNSRTPIRPSPRHQPCQFKGAIRRI